MTHKHDQRNTPPTSYWQQTDGPQCGHEDPWEHRFCSECGHWLELIDAIEKEAKELTGIDNEELGKC